MSEPLHFLCRLRRASLLAAAGLLNVWALPGQAMSPLPAQPPAVAASAPAPASAAASAPGKPASGAAPAARQDPSAPKPFAEVVRDAQRIEGFVPMWRKDERYWMELPPGLIGKPLLLSVGVSQSVGERGLYASQLLGGWLVEFRRVGNTIQLVALNTDFRADQDPQMALTVRQSFSESLLASAQIASAAHPQSQAVLIDAGFWLADLPSYGSRLEAAYRLSYGLDRGNSTIERVRGDGQLTSLAVKLHFAMPRIPMLPPTQAAQPNAPVLPGTLPDVRSLFVGLVYSLRQLPAEPMRPRPADARLGHFTDSFTELGDERRSTARIHYITRWRLEKKDAAAAVSEPVQPIVFWLDRNIPKRYRPAVEAGVLEWNKAFERIGFKNAVQVRQQPDDAEFDTLDASHASIRWFTGEDVGFARGPLTSDPRTGEVVDADIAMSDVFARGARRTFRELLSAHPGPGGSASPMPGTASAWPALGGAQPILLANALHGQHDPGHAGHEHCDHALESAREMHAALDLLEARGEIEPGSPEEEAFVMAVVKDTITHEVGHTLGLKHNFKASTVVTRAQLRDEGFIRTRGISGSVMDYNGYNLPLSSEPHLRPELLVQTGLGPYDFWAIEYAYKPLPQQDEAAELARIAARADEDPALVFADDADADPAGAADPLVNRFDLGDDPMAWSQRRMTLARELWQRAQERGVKPGDDPQRIRRSLMRGFAYFGGTPELLAKYVGGMYTRRPDPASGNAQVYRPVENERQRQALQLLTRELFSVESFRFRPEFLTAVGPEFLEWRRAPAVSVPMLVQQLQSQALARLLSPATAQRLLDLPGYLPEAQRAQALSLDELYGTVSAAIWTEAKAGKEVEPMRRSLQREHLRFLAMGLTQPGFALPADAASLVRWHATQLQAQLKAATAKPGLSVPSRAHYAESLALLTQALGASMSRN